MLLKKSDNKQREIAELEALVSASSGPVKTRIESELRNVRAGIKGEQESAYLIDFHYASKDKWIVIHDLRSEIAGRVAQIDHLLLNRMLDEGYWKTKHFHSGLKITEDGEFLRWNSFKGTYVGMPSPLAQNERHLAVLKDAFNSIEMPSRLGLRLSPTFYCRVLISAPSRVDRPKKFDTAQVIKADVLVDKIRNEIDGESALTAIGSVAKMVSADTLAEIAQRLVALHRPIQINYRKMFGRTDEPMPAVKADAQPPFPTVQIPKGAVTVCRSCGSPRLSIRYGKFGYYFKCAACDGNTPVKVTCVNNGHKERIRKDGKVFYRECAECKSSALYFTNPDEPST
jgi:hypothetical protein